MPELFEEKGAHVLVDGQFGSTGKGALAAWLAHKAWHKGHKFEAVISNAGPNSGHTFYFEEEKHVLKQLPTFAVYSSMLNCQIPVFLNAGAIIDPAILRDEALRYPNIPIYVHPNAAVITAEDKLAEHSGTVAAVAGTRSGTGAAIARKVLRDPKVVWGPTGAVDRNMPDNVYTGIARPEMWHNNPVFVEVSQGFSLGLHSTFYPKVTSRECTVMQAVADARIPAQMVTKVYMSVRTYPIRVGNVDGHSSGDCYHDQREISWSDIGVEPELTTVTKRPRRIFTWSDTQFTEALLANMPDFVFVNFANYLNDQGYSDLRQRINDLRRIHAPQWFYTLWGYGPKIGDIRPEWSTGWKSS